MKKHFTVIGLLILISLLTSGFKSSQADPTGVTIEFPLWYLIAIIAIVIILIVVLVVFLSRKAKRAKEKINPPIAKKRPRDSQMEKIEAASSSPKAKEK